MLDVYKRQTYDGSAGAHQWLDAENLVILGARDQADKDMIGKGIPLAVFYKFNIITKEYTKLFSLHKGIYDFRTVSYTHLDVYKRQYLCFLHLCPSIWH